MTKLRNIGYLRFGSKIRQGFAVATPSLTPRLSFFPFMDVVCCKCRWGDLSFYIGGSLPPPCRAVGLPAAPPPGGRGLHAIELKF